MSKKKTAISQTLNWISEYRKQNGGDYPQPDVIEAQLLMQKETEREQIEQAWNNRDRMQGSELGSPTSTAPHYYTNTYEQ